jgi:cell division protein FtsB
MEGPVNLLRKQVISEIKKRRLIFFTIVLLSFLYLAISFVFGDMGFLRYRELCYKKTHLETQIYELSEENKQLRSQIKLIKEEPFYTEKHGREDLGLAKPDEYIFLYDR